VDLKMMELSVFFVLLQILDSEAAEGDPGLSCFPAQWLLLAVRLGLVVETRAWPASQQRVQ
jgi:hypothetical protein